MTHVNKWKRADRIYSWWHDFVSRHSKHGSDAALFLYFVAHRVP